MSNSTESRDNEQTGDKRSRTGRITRVCLVVAVFVGVGVLLGWLGLRSPVVLHQIAGPALTAEAEQRGVGIEIETFSGVGITDIRAHGVTFEVAEGPVAGVIESDYVDLKLDVRASLSARRPVIGGVEAGAVRVIVDRDTSGRPSEDVGEHPDAEEADESSRGATRWFADELALRVEDLTVESPEIDTTAVFNEIDATVDVPQQQLVGLDGRAGVAGLGLDIGLDDGQVVVEPSSEELDKRLGPRVGLELGRITVDPQQLTAMLQNGGSDEITIGFEEFAATVDLDHALAVRTEAAMMAVDTTGLQWMAPEASIRGDDRRYELEGLEVTYRRDTPGLAFSTDIVDGQGGRIDMEGKWHLPTSLVEINAWFHDFHWDGTLPVDSLAGMPMTSASIDGAFHGDIDLVHQLLSIDGRANLREATIDSPLIADELIVFEDVEVGLPLTVDLEGGAVSLVGGTIGVADLTPLEVNGRLVEAGEETYAFEVGLEGSGIDARAMSQQLPRELTGVVGDSEIDGKFGLAFEARGHSAYPESFVLTVDLFGDVEVVEDVAWGERGTSDRGEVMLIDPDDSSGHLTAQGRWVELEDLPEHIAASVLAAEDTSFFEHDGLDWHGIEMAMEENIDRGKLVRGGSTITQQVAKNLYLTHDQTVARKLQEAFLTWRVEETLSKEEILELYLNVVEWGPEIQGLFAASHYFFDTDPENLSPVEMVMLSSILPNPIRFGGAIQEGYLPSSREDKMRRVLENLRFLDELSWDEYQTAVSQLDDGRIGHRDFVACADDETAPPGSTECDAVQIEGRDGEEMTFETWEVAETGDEAGWVPLTH